MKSRHLSSVVILITAASAFGLVRQDGRKISLTLQAMSVTSALKSISVATGLQLAASPQTAQDVVAVYWRDVPTDEALKKLADAVDGEWRTEGSVLRLVRPTDLQRVEESRERAVNVAELKKAIAKRVDLAKSQPQWNSQTADALAQKVAALMKRFNPNGQYSSWYQSASELSQEAPTGRVLTAILATLDPVELASIPTGIKTVWSTNPTAMQRAMPNQVNAVIEQYVQAQSEWNAAVLRHSLQYPTYGGSTYMVGGFGELGHPEEAVPQVATVLVSAERMGELSGFNVQFTAYDSKGKQISNTQAYLASEFMFAGAIDKKEVAAPDEPFIVLPDDGANLARAMGGQGRAASSPISDELVSKVVQCEKYDPLSWVASPSLIATAKIRGLNMVACLSDLCVVPGMIDASNKLRVEQLLNRFELYGSSVESDGGWLMVKPKRPVSSRSTRADRKVLAAFLQRILNPQPLKIEELAEFTAHLPDQQDSYLSSILAIAIKRAQRGYNDSQALRFFAFTTKEQRLKMQGEGLPIRSLNPQAQDCLFKMVYGEYAALQYHPSTQGGARQGFNQVDWELYSNGIMHEPTESLPSGFPDAAYVSLNMLTEPVAIAADGRNQFLTVSRAMSANDLAWQKYSQERPDLFPWVAQSGQQLNLSHLQFGHKLSMHFEFHFTPQLSLSKSLEEQNAAGEDSGGIESLPSDFKAAFEKAYEQYKKAYANAKPGQFNGPGQQNIPPQ